MIAIMITINRHHHHPSSIPFDLQRLPVVSPGGEGFPASRREQIDKWSPWKRSRVGVRRHGLRRRWEHSPFSPSLNVKKTSTHGLCNRSVPNKHIPGWMRDPPTDYQGRYLNSHRSGVHPEHRDGMNALRGGSIQTDLGTGQNSISKSKWPSLLITSSPPLWYTSHPFPNGYCLLVLEQGGLWKTNFPNHHPPKMPGMEPGPAVNICPPVVMTMGGISIDPDDCISLEVKGCERVGKSEHMHARQLPGRRQLPLNGTISSQAVSEPSQLIGDNSECCCAWGCFCPPESLIPNCSWSHAVTALESNIGCKLSGNGYFRRPARKP